MSHTFRSANRHKDNLARFISNAFPESSVAHRPSTFALWQMSTEGENMKKIAIKKAESTELPRDLDLEPGTTTYDVLKAIGLEPAQFQISIPNGEMLHGNDPLYTKVNDGDKLLVSERATVGA
jgi:hypothetical protein